MYFLIDICFTVDNASRYGLTNLGRKLRTIFLDHLMQTALQETGSLMQR